jgi:hypothetical protein
MSLQAPSRVLARPQTAGAPAESATQRVASGADLEVRPLSGG